MTDTPNFEARITALEKALTDELRALIATMRSAQTDPYRVLGDGIRAIQTVCGVARDYARRAEGE